MSAGRRRLVWGTPRDLQGYWRLGLWCVEETGTGRSNKRVFVSVRGLLRWSGGLLLAAYLVGVSGWCFWQQKRPYNFVTYTDALLLPVRWPQVREALGRSLVQVGLADLQAGRWVEGQMKLRNGLARAPSERRARVALAELYALTNRRPAALAVLEEGLGAVYPGRIYLQTYFELAARGEDYDLVVATCARFPRPEDRDRLWLTTQKLKALLAAGRAAEALAESAAAGRGAAPDIREAQVLALLALGREQDALVFLDEWSRVAEAANRAQVLRLKAQAFRQAGNYPEMETALALLQAVAPAEPRARALAVTENLQAGRIHEATEALHDYLFRFGAEPRTITQLAADLSEGKALDLVKICVDEAAARGFPARPFLQLLVETQIRTGDWAGAAKSVGLLERTMVGASPVDQVHLEWVRRMVAAAGAGAGAQVPLTEFLGSRPLPLRIFRQTAEALLAAGKVDAAGEVLALAGRDYPRSPTLAALRKTAEQAGKFRAVAAAPVRSVAGAPIEREFFTRVAELADARDWEKAGDLIRSIRVQKPAWFAAREPEVLEWQIKVAALSGDSGEMIASARWYLAGDTKRAGWLLTLARQRHDDGDAATASLLLGEVLRKRPDFEPALSQRAKWAPKKL